jgi:signal transduction histidine kinase
VKILNADDNAENLYLIETLFRAHGHEVVSVRNGQEALAAASVTGFDAIVSDLLMPKMDGFQLIQELRLDVRLQSIPIIIYTATYTDAKDEALVYRLGADRYLLKPAEGDELLRVVEEAIRDRKSSASAPHAGETEDEVANLKEHNTRLILKLEKKMRDLEQVNRALEEDIATRKRAEAERNLLEEQLRHAQKMEAIGTLAGGIAHDFNNVLTGILCAGELGIGQAERPEAVRKLFGDIVSAGTRARDLVKQILVFSRQQRVERIPLDLGIAVREALRFLRSTLPAGVELQTDVSTSLPSVLADPTQIHQIVTNLCTNAWHAIDTGSKGVIQVVLEAVEITSEQALGQPELCPARYVCLRVTDNGCGMDAVTRLRVFEPFFTTKPIGVGTGLGLSVVHGIMRSYDGAIVLESEPGKGSTFRLYFPVVESAVSPSPDSPGNVPRGQGQRVLFVDDEPLLVRLGESLLQFLGYSPLAFSNQEQALEAYRQNGADAVLVDFSMPGHNGLEFASRALAIQPKVPVVLMTGFSASLTPEQVRARGLSGLLPKPYNQDSLGRILRQVLNPMSHS